MKLLFLVAKDKIRQVSTQREAACLRFLGGRQCRLFEIDTVAVTTKEVEIPGIRFGE